MANFADRTIWSGDNLDILRGLNSAGGQVVAIPGIPSRRLGLERGVAGGYSLGIDAAHRRPVVRRHRRDGYIRQGCHIIQDTTPAPAPISRENCETPVPDFCHCEEHSDVAIPLKQRPRFQRRDCQPPHRVRGRNDKFRNFLNKPLSRPPQKWYRCP